MASKTNYDQEYTQAQTAYAEGKYEEAADIINRLIEEFPEEFPNDPSALLLQGHICCYGLQQYDKAREHYEQVLSLTSEPDFIEYAHKGIEDASHFLNEVNSVDAPPSTEAFNNEFYDINGTDDLNDIPTLDTWQDSEDINISNKDTEEDFADLNLDEEGINDELLSNSASPFSISEPFDSSYLDEETTKNQAYDDESNPFSLSNLEANSSGLDDIKTSSTQFDLETNPFYETDYEETADELGLETNPFSETDYEETADEFDLDDINHFTDTEYQDNFEEFLPEASDDNAAATFMMSSDDRIAALDSFENPVSSELEAESHFDQEISEVNQDIEDWHNQSIDESYQDDYPVYEDETLLMDSGELGTGLPTDTDEFDYSRTQNEEFENSEYSQHDSDFEQNGFNSAEHFDFDSFDDDDFVHESFAMDDMADPDAENFSDIEDAQNTDKDFLDAFDIFEDDLGSLPDFAVDDQDELSDSSADESDFDVLSNSGVVPAVNQRARFGENGDAGRESLGATPTPDQSYRSTENDEEIFSIGNSTEQLPVFNPPKEGGHEALVTVEQGWLAPFENASLHHKQWIISFAAGIASAFVVALVSFTAQSLTAERSVSQQQGQSSLMSLKLAHALASGAAFAASFGITLFLGRITTRQIQQVTADLQTQFDAVAQGNLNVSVPIYSEGELGQLAAGFNQMARVILTTTSEATRKAEEQEQAKEDLQRQVIRLLDDVEGAARGDLTVQAEVTADVLGAVADSFNLTIQNLREIVQQVKDAARKVTKGSTESAAFAGSLSNDALRQAEELAVTLNSVQVMTDSIQRVAEAAREAEEVAHTASDTAHRGGEAVEHTVAGILQIRETVAETTRKVKRLAESSQEISKIVAVISTIASRTNLLALNASIEAARAGEAGRGFAVVADEVRQLADRSAKALKEIEQIVMQIQSETGSVMTAMEEGTQQVIEGTKRAEQAKRALEDIIQVSNRIDTLVREIKADTVEQTETSRAVAQVMQSVELTAQETSQEAQRVSSALQNLVGVARDLLNSVERFRVESNENR